MTNVVNRIHLVYLGLLPSLTTFFLVRRYGHRAPFALFIGGIIVVAVYLAASYSYTVLPSSTLASFWALVDGPLFALAGRSWQAPAWTFIVEGFFIDAVALWLAILALCLVSPAPSSWQRGASFCLALIALASLLSLFFPYATDLWDGRWLRLGWLLVGVVETTALLYRLLDGGNPVRPDVDRAGLYVAVLTVAWVIAMSAGMALHQTRISCLPRDQREAPANDAAAASATARETSYHVVRTPLRLTPYSPRTLASLSTSNCCVRSWRACAPTGRGVRSSSRPGRSCSRPIGLR